MTSTSPLRYPGGKARFTNFIWEALNASGKQVELFAEPFCGGAGASISLLETGRVQRIALNDVDPLVANFWKIVFGRTRRSRDDIEWLIKNIESAEISIDEWRRQKALKPDCLRTAAWKCLYLNRTSFNGILHKAGPIGGWEQKNRTLSVRFNRERLVKRIFELHDLRTQVDRVDCIDWKRFCNCYRQQQGVYLYLDPPYYHRAEQLYGYLFDAKTHREMRNYLVRLDTPWLLSYDDAPEVRALYSKLDGIDSRVVDQTYSTHPMGGASFVGRELVFSNKKLPIQEQNATLRPHTGITIVGDLEIATPHSVGPIRTPIASRLLGADVA